MRDQPKFAEVSGEANSPRHVSPEQVSLLVEKLTTRTVGFEANSLRQRLLLLRETYSVKKGPYLGPQQEISL